MSHPSRMRAAGMWFKRVDPDGKVRRPSSTSAPVGANIETRLLQKGSVMGIAALNPSYGRYLPQALR